MKVELLPLDQLIAESDFVTVHLPKTKDTTNLVDRDLLLKAKPSLRVINVARGGIVNEEDLADAVREGIIAGAALDVFDKEPTTTSPLFELDSIVVTPHLGASTREAQDKAGDAIADMVQLALAGEFVPFAVNVNAAEANQTLRPFLPLAERLGRLFASLLGEVPDDPRGVRRGRDRPVRQPHPHPRRAEGVLRRRSATSRSPTSTPRSWPSTTGVEVRDTASSSTADYINLVTLRGAGHSMAATLTGRRQEPRIVMIDDHTTEVPMVEHLLVVRNDDRPGVIGIVGTMLGESGVNIADMDVGRTTEPGSAMMIIAPNEPVTAEVVGRPAGRPRHHQRPRPRLMRRRCRPASGSGHSTVMAAVGHRSGGLDRLLLQLLGNSPSILR